MFNSKKTLEWLRRENDRTKMNPGPPPIKQRPIPKENMSNVVEMLLRRNSAQHTENQVTGTLEVLRGGDVVFKCFTLELPWKNNERQVSCIMPAPGAERTYKARKTKKSPSFNYEHLDILDTPGRSYVKLHSANFAQKELKGCISVGDKLTDMNGDGELDATSSRKTLEKLLTFIPSECDLRIIWN